MGLRQGGALESHCGMHSEFANTTGDHRSSVECYALMIEAANHSQSDALRFRTADLGDVKPSCV